MYYRCFVMKDRTRRLELGKMLLDVSKFISTIVVVGGIVSDRVRVELIVLGVLMAVGFAGIGFQVIPLEEN